MNQTHQPARQNLRAGQVLFALTAMSGLISQAYAQQNDSATEAHMTKVEVTGYRASLETSARDKRDAVGFQDSVFAEDLGKFPDTNIAESLNRIPGIQITREVDGEGLNIQIRGLGTSYTKTLLNGAPVAVASTGRTDSTNTNREVDLDLLPTDLFRKLTVSKSPTASQIEGGAAGVVDMRTARPFDEAGRHFALNLTGMNNSVADKWGNRGSMLASNTWGKEFGVLGGFAWSQAKVHTTGFETVGWTNPGLSATQDTDAARGNTGGGNFNVPATVPAVAGNGLTPGATVDQAFLLAHNPGLTIQQIDNALLPRLGRVMDESGTKNKYTGVFSAEYRPTDALHFYVDTMYSKKTAEMMRQDMNWSLRNGAAIPLNMTVDRADCTNGCVATGGTFANTQSFLEFRPYTEDTKLWGLNPGVEWDLGNKWKVDGQVNLTKSDFKRQSPTVLVSTPNETITYANNGDIPSISSNLDLNSAANFGYNSGSRVNVQDEVRHTQTKGAHVNLSWGDKKFTIKTGLAYDDISRSIVNLDNSNAWQNAVCGNNPSVYITGTSALACNGIVAPGSAAGTYPGYGTGYTAGATGPVTFGGSLIPAANLGNYLHANPSTGFVTVDWNKFAKDSNYSYYEGTATQTGTAGTGANAGYIDEKAKGIYLETNGEADLAGMLLRYDAGVRYVRTHQVVGGFISKADPRNTTENLTANGSKYPNIAQFYYLTTDYNNTLPSASAALNLTKDLILRASASRSMTRANPDAMRPGTSFSDPSAAVGTIGNPALKPYISDNLDLGLEWYTGHEGYMSATAFQKSINGFTAAQNTTVPFSSLAAQGLTYADLSQPQKDAIDARGGPNVATVVMTSQQNASGKLKIQGLELGWVQPLDKWLPIRGFGFSENATFINQSASGQGAKGFIAFGVPKKTNSLTAYYQQHGYSLRLSESYTAGSPAFANSNGITDLGLNSAAYVYNDPYHQLDLSSSVDLDEVFDREGWPTLTFDVTNLNRNIQRQYFQYSNATYTEYKPGRTFSIGLRAKF